MTNSHRSGHVKWRKWRVNAMPTVNPAQLLKAISYPYTHRKGTDIKHMERWLSPNLGCGSDE